MTTTVTTVTTTMATTATKGDGDNGDDSDDGDDDDQSGRVLAIFFRKAYRKVAVRRFTPKSAPKGSCQFELLIVGADLTFPVQEQLQKLGGPQGSVRFP